MNGSLTWFWLSLFFALWTSISISIVKKLTSRMDLLLLILVAEIFLIPFILILIMLLGGIPIVSPKFFQLVFIAAILDSLAVIFSFYAIKISPISLISPISSFNPIFTTVIASLILQETLSLIKYFGILVVVLGAYLLNISDLKGGVLLPFKKLFTNKGVLFFLLANLIWATTPIFQKLAIFQTNPTSPLSVSLFENIIIIAFFIPVVLIRTKNKISQIQRNWKIFFLTGSVGALSTWAAFTAFSLAPLGLVTSVFKLSTLFTIGWGFLFFKEERIWERLLGAFVMIVGTLLLIR